MARTQLDNPGEAIWETWIICGWCTSRTTPNRISNASGEILARVVMLFRLAPLRTPT